VRPMLTSTFLTGSGALGAGAALKGVGAGVTGAGAGSAALGCGQGDASKAGWLCIVWLWRICDCNCL
jgi:hypothetical protein